MAIFDFKTATPVTTGVTTNFFWFGAASQSASTPSIYSMGAMTSFLSTATLAAGTITTSQPLTLTQTWNAGAVAFTGAKVNITNTSSDSASLLLDLQVGSSSQFKVRADGRTDIANSGLAANFLVANNGNVFIQTDAGQLLFGATSDTVMSRASAGYAQLTNGTLAGLADAEVFATTQVVTTLANNNSAQNVFASANDVLTLRATTTYFFEALYYINTGTTTHTTATGFVASSAFTNILYFAELWSTTSGTISTTAPSVLDVAVSTATVLNATSTAPRTTIRIRGIIRTNASTTVTPQITFSADPTGTCEVAINSYFRAWPVGTNTVAAFGAWA